MCLRSKYWRMEKNATFYTYALLLRFSFFLSNNKTLRVRWIEWNKSCFDKTRNSRFQPDKIKGRVK